jgi:hypothetical protein
VRVAYFTGGTRGAGHLVRGLAIGRALERAGFAGELQLIAPAEPPFPALRAAFGRARLAVAPIDPATVLDPDLAPSTELAATLTALAPDLVIVDMFWAPVRYILPLLEAEAWLLLRSCPPVWLRGNQQVSFAPEQYRRVIAIEPIDGEVFTDRIDPVVICNRDERRTRAELRERFAVPADRPIIAYTHAGLPGEIDSLAGAHADLGGEPVVLRFDLYTDGAVFPLAPWIGAADLIHSSAGYNSYWEARWLGFSRKTVITVFRRQIDDPEWRVRVCAGHQMRENGADVLARWIMEQ